jgi:starvation-inducible DNA-binding protein
LGENNEQKQRSICNPQIRSATDHSYAPYVEPLDMIAELREDNKTLAARLREAHEVCEEHRDIATASLIETWIDQTERRTWFLFETSRAGTPRH